MTPRERLLAAFTDPNVKPFDDAAAVCCSECGGFILWVNPPAPNAWTLCLDCQSDQD